MGSENKAIISQTPVTTGSSQVHFNIDKFNDAIGDKGQRAYIERTLRCPCAPEGVGSALPNCVNCGGTGYVLVDKVETTLLCHSLTSLSRYQVWSLTNTGTISITSRPEDRLGWLDRVTLIDLRSWFNERLYPKIATIGGVDTLFAFLIYPPTEVFQVYLFQTASQSLKYLIQNTDYTIDNNKIKLNSQYNNLVNPCITIRYAHNPAFHVIDIVRDALKVPDERDCKTGQIIIKNAPPHCIGKRAHYIFDAPNFNTSQAVDNTDYAIPPINYDK